MAQADVTRIADNIGALNSLWALQGINKQLSIHQARLSTGKRINSAADDPAGLTIATKLNARSEGLKVAMDNIGDGKNLLAVAEAGVGRITDIIIQMKNKASQAGSDTMGANERKAIYQQLVAYTQQVDDIVTQTEWNGNKLIDGNYNTANSLTFLTGANSTDTTTVNGLLNLRATAGGTGASLALASRAGGATSVASADTVDGGNIITDASEVWAAPTNTNLTALSAGTYTVKVTFGGALGANSTVQLLNEAGSPVFIDTVGDSAAAPSNPVALSATGVDLSAAANFDFGNGLTVNLAAAGAKTGIYTATVAVSDTGSTYSVFTDGDGSAGGVSLDPTVSGTAANYRTYMAYLEGKLDNVNNVMSKIGAFTGRLSFKEDQVAAAQINVEASYNRIMNANMAEEQVNASKFMVLQQTSMAMLAQANQSPQTLLSLFR